MIELDTNNLETLSIAIVKAILRDSEGNQKLFSTKYNEYDDSNYSNGFPKELEYLRPTIIKKIDSIRFYRTENAKFHTNIYLLVFPFFLILN